MKLGTTDQARCTSSGFVVGFGRFFRISGGFGFPGMLNINTNKRETEDGGKMKKESMKMPPRRTIFTLIELLVKKSFL